MHSELAHHRGVRRIGFRDCARAQIDAVVKKDHVRFIEIENNDILSETHCIWNKRSSSILLDHFLQLLPFGAV
ncbi:type 2 periplasmic-binding domain-containing protein [Acinetobacter ursingii]|uniref:hypothetical protein n=1 Tax=Acinetobacter ursingii TaxID=108980 RepID=UPI0021CD7287|nr:hypothetical protein [Acinetobacter ursingii]